MIRWRSVVSVFSCGVGCAAFGCGVARPSDGQSFLPAGGGGPSVDAAPEAPADSAPPAPATSDAGDASTLATDAGVAPSLAAPPARPGAGAATSTRRTFAIQRMFLGDTDRNGVASSAAWKAFGFDVDGVDTRTSRQGTCRPISNGVVALDGVDGIDNSFGASLLTAMQQVSPGFGTPSSKVTQAIAAGGQTMILDTAGLDDSATQSAIGLAGQLFVGASKSVAPRFDGTDEWPIDGAYLVDRNDLSRGAKTKFQSAYVRDGVWVSGPAADITIGLPLEDGVHPLLLRRAVITAHHVSRDNLTYGTISGAAAVADFVAMVASVAGAISPEACPGRPLFAAVKERVEASADVRLAGPDPTKDCDAISFGLGFDAKAVRVPAVVAPARAAPPDPCAADAGR